MDSKYLLNNVSQIATIVLVNELKTTPLANRLLQYMELITGTPSQHRRDVYDIIKVEDVEAVEALDSYINKWASIKLIQQATRIVEKSEKEKGEQSFLPTAEELLNKIRREQNEK